MSYNRLELLPAFIFSGLHKLKIVNASYNRLRDVDSKALFGIDDDNGCIIKLKGNKIYTTTHLSLEARIVKYHLMCIALTAINKARGVSYNVVGRSAAPWRITDTYIDMEWYNKFPVFSDFVRGVNFMIKSKMLCSQLVRWATGSTYKPDVFERILLKEDVKSLHIDRSDAQFYARRNWKKIDQYLENFKARRELYITSGIPRPKVIQRKISWRVANSFM